MKQITFLTIEEILDIHLDQIQRYGGASNIRDMRLLESAIHILLATFGGKYLHNDIYEMAAAYLFHIVKNHPFIDGNKRTATVAAIVFLAINDIDFFTTNEKLTEIVIKTATGHINKDELAAFFRESNKT